MTLPVVVNLGIYGIALVLGLIGALIGLRRGIFRQTIRFVSVVLSAVLTYLICVLVSPAVIGMFDSMTMEEFISMLGSFGISVAEPYQKILLCFDTSLVGYVMAFPMALIVVPVLFVLLFIIISALMIIVHKVVCGALAFTKRRNNIITRLAGFLVGFMQGVVVAIILLMPICGILSAVDSSIDKVNESNPEATNAVALRNTYDAFFDGADENLIVQASGNVAGFAYSNFARVKVEGEKVDLRNSITSALDVLVQLGKLSGSDFSCLNEQEQAVVEKMTADIYEDRYLAAIVSGFLSGGGTAIKTGAIVVTFPDPVGNFVKEYINVFSTSNRDNLGGDIVTTQNVFFLMGEGGALKTLQEAPAKVYEKFVGVGPDGKTLFGRLSEEFAKNPRMSGLSHELTKLSMSLLLANRDQDMAKTDEAISDVQETIYTVLSIDKNEYATEEEYKAAVNETVDGTLKEHGIELSDDEVNELSDYILVEFEGREDVTEAEIAEFMVKYYDIKASGGEVQP